jgi:hypothetical protein
MADIEEAISDAIEEHVEEQAEEVAEEAAEEVAEEVAEEATEEPTVQAESVPTQVNEAVAMTENFRTIAREEAQAEVMAWMMLAQSHQEPQVVVVAAPEPEPEPLEEEFGSEDVEEDEEPKRDHPYFRNFGSE